MDIETIKNNFLETEIIIVNKFHQKALELYTDVETSSQIITLKPITGMPNQRWKIQFYEGYFLVKSVNSPKEVLDIKDWSLEDGAEIKNYLLTGRKSQSWTFESRQDDDWVIKSAHSGFVLSFLYSKKVEGKFVHQWEDINHPSQHWKFQKVDNNKKQIKTTSISF